MGLMTGALQIGRSALLAYQSALQVLGNNVSNAGSATYSRQTAVLTPNIGGQLPEGFMPGGGVALSALRRDVDASLEARLRTALGSQASSLAQQQALSRVESVLNELTETDLSTLITDFFNSFRTVQNSPSELGARSIAITAGDTLAREIQRQRYDVLALRDELNVDIMEAVKQMDDMGRQVAELNVRITSLESSTGGSGANALRDQRDEMLRQMGQFVQIQTREQPDGSVNVYIGNDLYIAGGVSRGITTRLETTDSNPRVIVEYADNHADVRLQGGQLAGLAAARDTHVMGHVQSLNSLSLALINEVNKVHAQGQGLVGFESLTGSFNAADSTAALNSAEADLNLTPVNGSFVVYLTNTDTNPPTRVATTIDVDLDGVGTDESLQSLVAKLDAVENLSAEATLDGRLKLTADEGFEITFGEDSSHVLAALGMNAFFVGASAEDIGVNADLVANSDHLAVATAHAPGDGSNAGQIAALGTSKLRGLNGASVTDYYNAIATGVAVRGNAAVANVKANDAIVLSLSSQRESISGVSLDEEAINLMRFERAFQAAAQYTSVVDRLIEETLSLVR